MSPVHRHDSSCCTFYETYELLAQDGVTTLKVDVYHCGSDPGNLNTSIIQRFSSDGPDYWSMPATMVPEDPGVFVQSIKASKQFSPEKEARLGAYFRALYGKAREVVNSLSKTRK